MTLFVLVPADKAANNMIIVHYIDVVIEELKSTSTFVQERVYVNNLDSMTCGFYNENKIDVQTQLYELLSFYLLPKLHYGTRFLAAPNKGTTKWLASLPHSPKATV